MSLALRKNHIVGIGVLVLLLTAGCPPQKYALSVLATGQGSVTLNPAGGTYTSGTNVILTPVPAANWHFDHWTGALTGNANPAQVTMDTAKTLTAVFVQDQYALNLAITGSGSVTSNPPGTLHNAGTVVTLTPMPAANWHFDHWEGALTGNASPAQVTMNAAKTLTAVFVQDPVALALNIVGYGNVTLDPPGAIYNIGAVVTLTPAPSSGWRFERWEGALTGNTNPAQVTMDAAKAVTAVFVENQQYTLTLSVTGDGTVALDPPGGTYPPGTVVTLTPDPDADNRFEIWGGNLSGLKQPATITMDDSKYVQAFFMPKTYGSFSPNYLCSVGSTLYFLANGPYSGRELWKSDGTFEGTVLVRDIAPGNDTAGILFPTNFKDTLYFYAYAESSYWLWKSDGTEDGTIKVANLGNSAPALRPVQADDMLYWSASGMENGELWITDGTAEGTRIVKSFGTATGMRYSNPNNLTNVDGILYFNNSPQQDMCTLWKSDGTQAGTVAIYSSQYLSEIASLNGQVFFYGGDYANDALLTTNGTPEGTRALHSFDFGPGDFTLSGSLLYFAAESGWDNTQIWATNGTTVYKVSNVSYRPWDLTNLNGALLYIALYTVDSQPHCGIFSTTGSGATLLREINQHLFYGYGNYRAVVDDILFFTAENSTGGVGLWKTDGTSAGTVMVSDINLTPVGITPYELTAGNGTLYFSAGDETNGHQLWKSDGTQEGTLPVSCPTP